jgi:parallel beta-helix repeat protein
VTNFGIGLIAAADTGNIIEGNTIVGNTNGIYLAAGVQGNIFHGNVIVGNPPVQVAIEYSSSSGADILNLATAGANAFEGNVCLTSVNAPCAFIGPSLTANPNPIPVTANALFGSTTISWNAPDAQVIEIHIGSPNGPLFAEGGNRGSAQTALWVSDGTTFYLQDVTDGKPLTSDYTLATLVVHLAFAPHAFLRSSPLFWVAGASGIPLFGLVMWRRRSCRR